MTNTILDPMENRQFEDGLAAGAALSRSITKLPIWAGGGSSKPADGITLGPDAPGMAAQNEFLSAGKKLSAEETAKRKFISGLDTWDLVLDHARDGRFPKGTDVFMMKFQGMFHVAPAQDSFMCRMRFAGGLVSSHQMRGIATLAQQYAGDYIDCTTRSNLQLREIGPKSTVDVLTGLADLGIIVRGSGADNIRNVTCTPTAGIDPDELIDTRPLARQMHHYILNHREMYGLPRKFNIAFDGSGRIASLEDTNDIGFTAVRVTEGNADVPAGIYFRLVLGGITGHKDFARDTGVICSEAQCVPVAAAILRVFIDEGDRTDRRKARLKYVLDRLGFDGFLKEVEKRLQPDIKLLRFPLAGCAPRPLPQRWAHVGFHPQKQAGTFYVGVVLPVGRLTTSQARAIADIADQFGSGGIRLTVWQNLLIPDIDQEDLSQVKQALTAAGLEFQANAIRAGLVACTGATGCKFAAAHTKEDAMAVARQLSESLELDQPINIHLTGCHNSCAQHFIGDIGMIGTKIGDDQIEGYHVFVGGGHGEEKEIGRELYRDVPSSKLPEVLENVLGGYLKHRRSAEESFHSFVQKQSVEELRSQFEN